MVRPIMCWLIADLPRILLRCVGQYGKCQDVTTMNLRHDKCNALARAGRNSSAKSFKTLAHRKVSFTISPNE
jgi:hypothetical protein